MMNTPICDFIKNYSDKNYLRLHMPGHKGLGDIEKYDITEIPGADSLYEASGIIKESEDNASKLFGCRTYFSTEGSSHCVRTMLFLATLYARSKGRKPLVYAARNVHKVFLHAAAMLDVTVEWIYPQQGESYLSCTINAESLEKRLNEAEELPVALYLTSPDYLGNTADIASIACICRKHGVLLIVDNAHGAYLRFLPQSQHPIDLGADICCDSAHKTLPVLTGGAYLHLSDKLSAEFSERVKDALSFFGSTSPSYLILESLDKANKYLSEGYSEKLRDFKIKLDELKGALSSSGWILSGDEPLKITLKTKEYGYLGSEINDILTDNGIVAEFFDPDHIVFMFTPEITDFEIHNLKKILLGIPKKEILSDRPPVHRIAHTVLSIRNAVFASSVETSVTESMGKVLADASVGCPPAVPILVCGELIDENAVNAFKYYGIKKVKVCK